MKKRLLAILLAAFAVCGMTAVPASTEGIVCNEENCTHTAAIEEVHYDTLKEAVADVKHTDTIFVFKTPADDDIAVVNTAIFFTVMYEREKADPYGHIVEGDGITLVLRGMSDEIYNTESYRFCDCRITFDPNGGTSSSDSFLFDGAFAGNVYSLPGAFRFTAPLGMRFGAWEMDGVKYYATERVMINNDVTVKAIWVNTDEIYTITFDANDGTEPQSVTTNNAGKLDTVPVVSREGWEFEGWYTKDDRAVQVTPYQIFFEDITLFARWSPAYVPGDLSGDGAVDLSDAILLFRHSMMPELYEISYQGNPDFTGDGAIDIADAILLFRHSMMPDIYPIGY